MHGAYFATLIEELSSRGFDVDSLFPQVPAEITPTWLANALVAALQATGDPALSLAFGQRLNLASHGILGYALMSSRNGDQLLGLLTRYASLAMPNLSLRRVSAGERLLLTCQADEGLLPRQFVIELALTTLATGARALFNRRIPQAEVWLDFPMPAYADRYAVLKVPVRFSQPYSALVCHRSFLTMQVASANAVMAEIGERQCEDLLAQMRARSGMAQQVRRRLLRAPGKFPSQEAMAAELHISVRTLRRRLNHEQITYRDIVAEVRYELARRYLSTSELTVGQIGDLLGYDDTANFRRAFKRWSGKTAQAWREAKPGAISR
jgi:AraC-like DNA-binding protein